MALFDVWYERCLPVYVSLIVLLAFSTGSLGENRVYSRKDVYSVNERMEIICIISSKNVEIRNVLFKQYQSIYNITKYLKPTKVFNDTVILVIPSGEIQNGGTYRCVEERNYNQYMVLTTIPKTLCVIGEVIKPKAFKCVNYFDQNKLVCSWDTDQVTYWQLEYKVAETDENFTVCNETKLRTSLIHPTNCHYYADGQCNNNRNNSCILRLGDAGYTFDKPYVFRLTGCNKIGEHTWMYKQYINQSIVKLNAVTNLEAYPYKRHIKLSWNLFYPPCAWENGIECMIYDYNQRLYTMQANVLHLKEQINVVIYTHNIKYLIPYTNYTISVCCRPSGSFYWSDNNTIYTTTVQDVPSAGPDFVPNGFSYYNCHGSETCLALYWQNLDVISSQGEIISYIIMVNTSSGGSFLYHNVSSQVQSVYLKFPVDDQSVYDVYGWSLNSQGVSTSYSYIHIPTRNKASVCVDHEYKSNTNTYKVWYSGFGENAHVNVTYYWCQGVVERPLKVICRSNVYWKQTTNTSLLIPADHSAFHFAVSINSKGESTGLVWKQCHQDFDTGTFEKTVGATIGGTLIFLFLILLIWLIRKGYRKVKKYNPPIDPPEIHVPGVWEVKPLLFSIKTLGPIQSNSIQDDYNGMEPSGIKYDKEEVEGSSSDQNEDGHSSQSNNDSRQYLCADGDVSTITNNVSIHTTNNVSFHTGVQSNCLVTDGSNINAKLAIGQDILEEQIVSEINGKKSVLTSNDINISEGHSGAISLLPCSLLGLDEANFQTTSDNMIKNEANDNMCDQSCYQDNISSDTKMSPAPNNIPVCLPSKSCSSENIVVNTRIENMLQTQVCSQSEVSVIEKFSSDSEFENDTEGEVIRGCIDEKETQTFGYIKADDIINHCPKENNSSVLLEESNEYRISKTYMGNQFPGQKKLIEPKEYVSHEEIKNQYLVSLDEHLINLDKVFDNNDDSQQHVNEGHGRHTVELETTKTDEQGNQKISTTCDDNEVEKNEENLPNILGNCANKYDKPCEVSEKEITDCQDLLNTLHEYANGVTDLTMVYKNSDAFDYIDHDSIFSSFSESRGGLNTVDVSPFDSNANQKKEGETLTHGDLSNVCSSVDVVCDDDIVDEAKELRIFKRQDDMNNTCNDNLEHEINDNIDDNHCSEEDEDQIQNIPAKVKLVKLDTNTQLELEDAHPTNSNIASAVGYSSESAINLSYIDEKTSSAESEIGHYVKSHAFYPETSVYLYQEQIEALTINSESHSKHDSTYKLICDPVPDKIVSKLMSETPDSSLCKINTTQSFCNRSKTSFKIVDNQSGINGYVREDILRKKVSDSLMTAAFSNGWEQAKSGSRINDTGVHETRENNTNVTLTRNNKLRETEPYRPEEDSNNIHEQHRQANSVHSFKNQGTNNIATMNTENGKVLLTTNKVWEELLDSYTKVTIEYNDST